ncbi:DUF779 domain-containing protein [Streptomyces sp. SL13]|uniref:DUF779 domain-containing protein n=1 Tax=Streptantibioticus silvisoli TaxID=2705255 RepID=A0AA90KBY1_9ACTN|nr:DUF779 domain-containing protein [Streptantibioticus silvisoli]MDI5974263.1 DUF779 domain-containing protein [Streptantibioticus silvisoli]
MPRVERVTLTPAARETVDRLTGEHGPVMFHQSGGCCDGSSPMCYPLGEFRVGSRDVLLGRVGDGVPFWMSADQYAYWSHTHLTVDVVPGRGSGFSLEAPDGVRFLIRSRLMTDEEAERLTAEPPLPTGADTPGADGDPGGAAGTG